MGAGGAFSFRKSKEEPPKSEIEALTADELKSKWDVDNMEMPELQFRKNIDGEYLLKKIAKEVEPADDVAESGFVTDDVGTFAFLSPPFPHRHQQRNRKEHARWSSFFP